MSAPTLPHPTEVSYERAAQGMAAGSRPTPLGAWREVARTGTLAGDPDPDRTAAGLVRRWHQHLAVAVDLPLERLAPGEGRLRAVLTAWLDVARRTGAVRAHVARTSGERARAEAGRQRVLLAGLLAEDLAVLGVPLPLRSAADLLDELAAVAAAEDAAGRPLRAARSSLLAGLGDPSPARPSRLDRARHRLAGWLRPAPVA